MTDKEQADRVEARVREYVHRAKRMTVDMFGPDTTHDHNMMTVNLAAAMVNLEAAELIARTREDRRQNDR